MFSLHCYLDIFLDEMSRVMRKKSTTSTFERHANILQVTFLANHQFHRCLYRMAPCQKSARLDAGKYIPQQERLDRLAQIKWMDRYKNVAI
jgi:hypothetical protein